MAKRLNQSSISTPSKASQGYRSMNRSDIEQKIGMSLKEAFNTPFTRLINGATVKCTYYPINGNESTWTEGIGQVGNTVEAIRFDRIRNFVLIDRDQEEIDDRPTDDRQIQINLTPKQSIVLGGTILPKPGDHIVLDSHRAIQRPFRVNKVLERKLIDREVYLIEYAESDVYFNVQDLDDRVIRDSVYVEENIGTQAQVVMDIGLYDNIQKAKEIMDALGRSYVDTFYSTKFQGIYFQPEGFAPFCRDHGDYVIFHYRALPSFQVDQQVMKWGYDRNTLFLTDVYEYDREEANYRSSLYEMLRRRRFRKHKDQGQIIEESGACRGMDWLKACLPVRDFINAEQILMYDSEYAYKIKLYFRTFAEHMILTPFINTGVTLVELCNTVGFADHAMKEDFIHYELKQPYCCKFLDDYMKEDYKTILQDIDLLQDYYPDKSNLDDYMGIPMLLFVLQQTVQQLSKSNRVNTYA